MVKLGILGLSPGNGHPYSWSAIFNGYRPELMTSCGFPSIPDYLSRQQFPQDCLTGAKVTHVWTQDENRSKHIAKTCHIDHWVSKPSDMIGQVDAIILARDDYQFHYEYAKLFLTEGVPIFIDKPLEVTVEGAQKIFAKQSYEGQIFSTSSFRYAEEFYVDKKELSLLEVRYINASISKSWDTYAVHIVEPIIALLGCDFEIATKNIKKVKDRVSLSLELSNGIELELSTLGNVKSPVRITLGGENGFKDMVFNDPFKSFKNTLAVFLKQLELKRPIIPERETLKVVSIIEEGLS